MRRSRPPARACGSCISCSRRPVVGGVPGVPTPAPMPPAPNCCGSVPFSIAEGCGPAAWRPVGKPEEPRVVSCCGGVGGGGGGAAVAVVVSGLTKVCCCWMIGWRRARMHGGKGAAGSEKRGRRGEAAAAEAGRRCERGGEGRAGMLRWTRLLLPDLAGELALLDPRLLGAARRGGRALAVRAHLLRRAVGGGGGAGLLLAGARHLRAGVRQRGCCRQ